MLAATGVLEVKGLCMVCQYFQNTLKHIEGLNAHLSRGSTPTALFRLHYQWTQSLLQVEIMI